MQEKTNVEKLMEKKLQAAMTAGKVQGYKPIKVQVSLRINPVTAVNLDVLASALGDTRTGLAIDLLHAAVNDAARKFNIPAAGSSEWLEQYGDQLRELLDASHEEWSEDELAALANLYESEGA